MSKGTEGTEASQKFSTRLSGLDNCDRPENRTFSTKPVRLTDDLARRIQPYDPDEDEEGSA
jgi:hypothetical protein